MKLSVGTSGFSYQEWKGSFYPADLAADAMLAYYAARLPAVEINNTFYRLPKESVLLHWAEQVPKTFTFVLKASRRITHEKRLQGAEEALTYLLDTAGALGTKLGPLLFQLPPFQKKDTGRLRDFLSLLPAGCRAAFEFRHTSWFDDEVYTVLSDTGAALCIADAGDPAKDAPLVATTSWGYLRLRREQYGEEELADWVRKIRDQHWDQAFVFFKHEDEGSGPRLAASFEERWSR